MWNDVAGKNQNKKILKILNKKKILTLRRAHRNDLENVLPYLIMSFVYVLSNPVPVVAVNLFRVVFGCRVFHTIVYAIFVLPQPSRAIGWFVPYVITIYMAVQSAIVFVN